MCSTTTATVRERPHRRLRLDPPAQGPVQHPGRELLAERGGRQLPLRPARPGGRAALARRRHRRRRGRATTGRRRSERCPLRPGQRPVRDHGRRVRHEGHHRRRSDDYAARWSAWGYTDDGFRKPETQRPRPLDDGPFRAASTMLRAVPRTQRRRPGSCGCPAPPSRRRSSRASQPRSSPAPELDARSGEGRADADRHDARRLSRPAALSASASSTATAARRARHRRTRTPVCTSSSSRTGATGGGASTRLGGSRAVSSNASWARPPGRAASWASASWSSASWSSASWASASWAPPPGRAPQGQASWANNASNESGADEG